MTVFTNEMVTGNSQTGKERRRALKMLYDERLLHFAINLTLLKQGEQSTMTQFRDLFSWMN